MTTIVDLFSQKIVERAPREKQLFQLCALQAAAAARQRSERMLSQRIAEWSEAQELEWIALIDLTNSPPGAAFQAAAVAWDAELSIPMSP